MYTLEQVIKQRIKELEEEYHDLWKSSIVCQDSSDKKGWERNRKWMERNDEKKRELQELLDEYYKQSGIGV